LWFKPNLKQAAACKAFQGKRWRCCLVSFHGEPWQPVSGFLAFRRMRETSECSLMRRYQRDIGFQHNPFPSGTSFDLPDTSIFEIWFSSSPPMTSKKGETK
jgi:hypothetical protein